MVTHTISSTDSKVRTSSFIHSFIHSVKERVKVVDNCDTSLAAK